MLINNNKHYIDATLDVNFYSEDGNNEEDVVTMQAWTLAMGLGCGVLAHMASRIFSRSWSREVAGNRSQLEDMMNFPFSMDNKMVLVVRTDLQMGKGKVAAQCAHGAVDLYKKSLVKCPKLVRQWETFGQAKITLKGNIIDFTLRGAKRAEF